MSDPLVGEIRLFAGNFAPVDWHLCDGSLLNIGTYQTLYSLLGTAYGGDGISTFGLPDLRGRVPVGQGTGPNLTARTLGQSFGSETVTVTAGQAAAHSHGWLAATTAASLTTPAGNLLAATATEPLYDTVTDPARITPLAANACGSSDGPGGPHDNVMPSFALNYIICLNGIYPNRN